MIEIAAYIAQSLLPVSTMVCTYATYVRSSIVVWIHCLRVPLDHTYETKSVRFVLIQPFISNLMWKQPTASVIFPSMAVRPDCRKLMCNYLTYIRYSNCLKKTCKRLFLPFQCSSEVYAYSIAEHWTKLTIFRSQSVSGQVQWFLWKG